MNARAHRTRAHHNASGLGTVIRTSLNVFRQVRQRTRSHPDSTPRAPPKRLKHPVDPGRLSVMAIAAHRKQPRGEPPKPNRCDDSLTLKVAKLPCPANARGGGQRTGNQATPGSASGGGGAPRTQFLSELSRSDFNTETYICEDSQTTASRFVTTGGCPPMLKQTVYYTR